MRRINSVCISLIIVFLLSSNLTLGKEIQIVGEEVCVKNDNLITPLIKDKKKKDFIRINKKENKVVFKNKNEIEQNGALTAFYFTVYDLTNDDIITMKLNNLTYIIDSVEWLDNENFYVLGRAYTGHNILTIYKVVGKRKNEIIEINNYLIGKNIAIQPNLGKIIYSPRRHKTAEGNFKTDHVKVINIGDFINSPIDKKNNIAKFSKVLFPNNEDEKNTIVSNIICLENGKVYFISNVNQQSYLVQLQVSKDDTISNSEKIPLKNVFRVGAVLTIENNTIEINGFDDVKAIQESIGF